MIASRHTADGGDRRRPVFRPDEALALDIAHQLCEKHRDRPWWARRPVVVD
jgi:hypothetical protein